MAKKRKPSDETITITNPDGTTTVVPRGDLNDEQWSALTEQFMKPATEADQTALEAKQPTYEQKKAAAANSANAENADFAAKRDAGTQESRAGADALKAADVGAAHTAATDHTGEDFIEVKGPKGQKVTVMRGPLDDAEWNKRVQEAKDNGRLINAVETVPTAQDPVPGTGTGTKAGIVKSMAAKLAEGGYQQGADYGKKMADAANPDVPAPADTDAAAKGKAAAQAVGNVDDLLGGEATKPNSTAPAGSKARMLAAARADAHAPVESPTLSREVDPGLQQLQGQKTDLLNAALPQDPPPSESTWDKVRGVAGPALSAVGSVLPGVGAPIKILGDAITPAAPTQPAGYGNPNSLPPVTPGPGMPANYSPSAAAATRAIPGAQGGAFGGALPTGGSAGGSVKASASGGPGGMQIPSMPDRQKEIDTAYANADQARQANADLQAKGMKDQADILQKGMDQQQAMQLQMMQSQERQQKIMEDGAKAYQATIAQMTEPAKIDPDHWWNSRSTAQKIFAVLSAGLTKGATLGMFQHAIDRDVAAQESDISNKRNALGAKAAGQLNGMQIARQNGLDLFEAQRANKAFAWDQIDKQAKMAALNTSSAVVKTNATEISAIAQQQKIKEETSIDQHRQLMALEGEKLKMEDRHNRSMEGAAWTRANKAGGEKPGQPLRGPQAQNIIDLKNALQSAKNYSKEFKDKASGFFSKISAYVPKTDASNYNARRDVAIQLIGKALEGGVLREDDIKRYERMIPEAGNMQGAVRWDQMIKELDQRLNGKTGAVQGFKAANFNTGSMQDFAGGDLNDEETASQLGFQGE